LRASNARLVAAQLGSRRIIVCVHSMAPSCANRESGEWRAEDRGCERRGLRASVWGGMWVAGGGSNRRRTGRSGR
jgi:hypothetical protein